MADTLSSDEIIQSIKEVQIAFDAVYSRLSGEMAKQAKLNHESNIEKLKDNKLSKSAFLAQKELLLQQYDAQINLKKLNAQFKTAALHTGTWSEAINAASRESENQIDNIKKLQKAYSDETDSSKKRDLQNNINTAENELENHKKAQHASLMVYGLGWTLKGLGNTVLSLTKHFMDSSSGVSIGGEVLVASVKAASGAVQGITSAGASLGTSLSHMKGVTGVIGVVITKFSEATGKATEALSELAITAINIMVTKTNQLLDSFKTMNNVGAVYTEGMLGMITAASDGGMTMDQFSHAVSANKEIFANSGLTVAEGSKKMAASMKAGGEGFRNSMFALGLSMEDQADLTAKTMAIMAGSSGKLNAAPKEIAEQTQEYAKNLKLLSSLTGEDAKTKQASIQKANDNLFMQQQINAMSETDRMKFQEMQHSMSETDMRALTEKMKYGHVISTDLAAASALSPAIQAKWDAQYRAVKDGTMSAIKGAQIQKDAAATIHEQTMNNTAISIASGGVADGVNAVLLDLNKSSMQYTKNIEDASNVIDDRVKAGKEGSDMAAGLMSASQNMLLQQQQLVIEALPLFASAVTKATEEMSKAFTALHDAFSGKSDVVKTVKDGLLGLISSLDPTTLLLPVIMGGMLSKGKKAPTLVGDVAASTVSSGKSASAGAGALGNIAKEAESIGAAGAGAGGGIRGILSGIASGLTSFTPAIPVILALTVATSAFFLSLGKGLEMAGPALEPLGKMFNSIFTGIGQVIVDIGISASTVIKSLASSILSLSVVNPLKLAGLAIGMTALGASMLPFGMGGALASLLMGKGGFSNVTDGLKQFEALDPIKLVKVAEAMKKVSDSMPSITQMAAASATGLWDKLSNAVTGSTPTTSNSSGVLGGVNPVVESKSIASKVNNMMSSPSASNDTTTTDSKNTANTRDIESKKIESQMLSELKKVTELLNKQMKVVEEHSTIFKKLLDVNQDQHSMLNKINIGVA
jgi:hypothetical protein